MTGNLRRRLKYRAPGRRVKAQESTSQIALDAHEAIMDERPDRLDDARRLQNLGIRVRRPLRGLEFGTIRPLFKSAI
jgi:hypothetical protein